MKKTVAKYLCILLSVALLFTALPLTVYAEDSVTVKDVGSATELETVCYEINTNGGEYVINLTGDIENGSMSIKKESAVVTVIGNGHTIFTSNYAFYIENGAKVNLGDGISKLIIEGDNQSHHDPGLVYIKRGSTCIMNNNVTLKNHKGDNYLGGGVTVEGGTFVVNGGNIDNCGIGSNCEATDFGGGVAMVGAGNINKLNSRFNLISGTISGNKASGGAGVFASGYHFAKTNPISMNATIDGISVPSSGGTSGGTESIAASNPGLFINGGLITENTATGRYAHNDNKTDLRQLLSRFSSSFSLACKSPFV